MARFYSNENFPWPVVEFLRAYGHDVLTIQETGKANQAMPDEAVLQFATQEKRIVLTFNRKHFINLHKLNSDHAGIIVCTFDANFAALAQRIDAIVTTETSTSGQLFRVNRPQE